MKDFIEKMASRKSINLQLFAEGGENGAGDGDPGNNGGNGDDPKPIVFDSQSEFDSAVDKQITKALNTAQEKWKAESQQAIEAAKSEAEKMANMTAEQQAEAKRQKDSEELASREADITRRELRAQSLEQLAEKELPKELVDVVVLTDAESCSKSIEAVEKAFRSAVEAGVNKRLAASAVDLPGGTKGSGPASKESIGKRLAQNNTASKPKSNPYFKEN
ncbi:DUF4355 domain-containing protein [Enterococcus caccae]|uniref:Phage scaffold protein n=1 Tax=Enterococcus caccae ATCC BAA-1240 TaxID=1158612 RepID=R3WEC6_9ENTE|nr:DUF4355 domain-containing protein [Enterococcus caccae]EOL45812.1 hypothetical protein UC7_01609 [Enterococcus caccae ATCC BAA-1240]EOT61008.1 hypothetical protein I580_01910 [Enterococcus caccae ATCC BAA-1240]OJG27961.1 hypothetical protein RU98_GL002170 [Enterococcus caccae]